jgi:hypothetical protein
MKIRTWVAVGLLGTVGWSTLAASAEPVQAAKVQRKVLVAPKGIRWGMTLAALTKVYESYFDDAYRPVFAKSQPGTAQQALEGELADKKDLLRRNHIEFGSLPTGVDQSALKPEYSYENGESMTKVRLNASLTRHFFFFNGKLWKIYDEYKLAEGGNLGANFEEAVAKLTESLGGKPKIVEPDFPKGRLFQEARWTDGTNYIRAVSRDPILAIVYTDQSIEESLAEHRRNKPRDPTAIDSSVRAVTSSGK